MTDDTDLRGQLNNATGLKKLSLEHDGEQWVCTVQLDDCITEVGLGPTPGSAMWVALSDAEEERNAARRGARPTHAAVFNQ